MFRFRETSWLPPVSSQYLDPGDRFIPTRSLMDISKAQSLLTCKANKNRKPGEILTPARAEYRRKLEENLTLDEEGRPFRMLVFRASPKKPKTSANNLIQDEDLPVPKIRRIPECPAEILDAPGLKNDYYLNLMDWGKTDILAVALSGSVYLRSSKWNAAKQLLSSETQNGDPSSVAWSPDGKMLAVGFEQCRIEVWDVESLKLARIFEGHKSRVGSLSWNHNVLSTGSYDARIINHDIRTDNRRKSKSTYLKGHTGEVCGLKWSCCGRFLASGGNDKLLHIWDSYMMMSSSSTSSPKYLHQLTDHTAAVRALAWCPFRSNLLASGGGTEDKCIKLWNVQAGRCTSSIVTDSQVCALEWNRHQRELLSSHGYNANRLSLWSYPSMSKIADLKGHQNRVLHLAQSPDGSTIASGGADETIRFWKLFELPSSSILGKHDPESDSPLSLKKMHIR